MKTCTVTWICWNNFGTLLQAYALQRYLCSKNIHNEIIFDRAFVKYQPPLPSARQEVAASVCDVQPAAVGGNVILRKFRSLFTYIAHPKLLSDRLAFIASNRRIDRQRRKELFQKNCCAKQEDLWNEFKKSDLSIRYGVDKSNVAKLNDDYDAFICGSDQIWSILDHNFNGYYFLDFATKKKIAYAPSIGTDSIPEERLASIRAFLKDFDAVSVREKQTSETLSRETSKNVEWVSDPTLLFGRDFWSDFTGSEAVPKKKYLLCYVLENKDWYFEYAKRLAKHLNLKLVILPGTERIDVSRPCVCEPARVRKFVALVKSASFVLTDSYHGLLFSLQFEKQFLYLKRFADTGIDAQNIRLYSILDYFGLRNLVIPEKHFALSDVRNVDYGTVTPLLEKHRLSSRRFLDEALDKVQNV